MLEMKDGRALLWSCLATVAAACIGREAIAGNYVEVVVTNANVQYFSVQMSVGQQLKCTGSTSTPVQLLIDDITYGVQVSPGYPNVPVYPCLWSAPEFTTTYEATGVWNFSAINPNWFTSFGIGFLPSGAAIVIDTESWSPFALYQRFGVEMWEADNVGNPVRRLDETNQMIHAAMYARMEHVPGAVTGDALGLNISETLATVSESRRYQTPHIIPNPNTLACVQNTISSYVSTQIFVKGRVVVNGADALTENGDMVVY